MKKLMFTLLALAMSQSAHAVVTKNCPTQFRAEIADIKLYSDAFIRESESIWNYEEEDFQQIFDIRDYADIYKNLGLYVLISQKNSRCLYASITEAAEVSSKATFFTSQGKDYLRIDTVQSKSKYDARFRSYYMTIDSYSTTDLVTTGADILYGDSALGSSGSIGYTPIGKAKKATLTVGATSRY